jgi:hypothetical protein
MEGRLLMLERTKEFLEPGNEGIRDTQEEANILYKEGIIFGVGEYRLLILCV